MVESMFTNWEKFRQPPRHPKWRDVNLAATVPGWTRWSVAEEMLKKMNPQGAGDPQVASGDFATFLRSSGAVNANLTPEQRDKLFREYMQWQAAQRGARPQQQQQQR